MRGPGMPACKKPGGMMRTCAACRRVEVPSISVSSSSSSWPYSRQARAGRAAIAPTMSAQPPAALSAGQAGCHPQGSGRPVGRLSLCTTHAPQRCTAAHSSAQRSAAQRSTHLQVQLLPHLLAQLSYPHHVVAQLVQVLVLPPACAVDAMQIGRSAYTINTRSPMRSSLCAHMPSCCNTQNATAALTA